MSTPALPELPTIDDFNLFLEVVTHKDLRPTSPDEPREWGDSERLAELGSQVLNSVVTFHFFEKRPPVRAEEIRTWRKHYTEPNTLHGWVDQYQLKQKLRTPPNQADTIFNDDNEMASYFHSYVGALYLTKGQPVIQAWITNLIDPDSANTGSSSQLPGPTDIHSQSQASSSSSTSGPTSSGPSTPANVTVALINQIGMKKKVPIEFIVSSEGPPHLPIWTARCNVDKVERGVGVGQNQKIAKEEAARQALVAMEWGYS